ncbi:MAG TPA: sigma-70 family RNA polymerase sigma factor [Pyrinomonadaceae bacterium]
MARSEPAQKVRPTGADERLLIEAAQRDRARFADIYEEYFELVYAYVARRVRDRSTAEDLTSDVFHKALANLPRFKWTGAPFASWLFRIASNLIADRARRKAKTSATSEEIELIPQDSRKDSQSGLEDVERQAQLFRLVNGLPEDQRRVVALRFAEDKSIKEISNELGRSEGAVKQLQFRALENLRKKFTTEKTEESKSD